MQEGLSDFLKTAYAHNRVKDLKDAFDEYPPEEEWHKGKIENVLKALKNYDKKLEKYKDSFYNNLKNN